jgi:hypothetical protein
MQLVIRTLVATIIQLEPISTPITDQLQTTIQLPTLPQTPPMDLSLPTHHLPRPARQAIQAATQIRPVLQLTPAHPRRPAVTES